MKNLPTLKLPKTVPVAPVAEPAARRFERREAAIAPPKAGSRLKRETVGERVTVYLPPALAAEVRRRCLEERRSVSDAMTEAAQAWLSTSSHVAK